METILVVQIWEVLVAICICRSVSRYLELYLHLSLLEWIGWYLVSLHVYFLDVLLCTVMYVSAGVSLSARVRDVAIEVGFFEAERDRRWSSS